MTISDTHHRLSAFPAAGKHRPASEAHCPHGSPHPLSSTPGPTRQTSPPFARGRARRKKDFGGSRRPARVDELTLVFASARGNLSLCSARRRCLISACQSLRWRAETPPRNLKEHLFLTDTVIFRKGCSGRGILSAKARLNTRPPPSSQAALLLPSKQLNRKAFRCPLRRGIRRRAERVATNPVNAESARNPCNARAEPTNAIAVAKTQQRPARNARQSRQTKTPAQGPAFSNPIALFGQAPSFFRAAAKRDTLREAVFLCSTPL